MKLKHIFENTPQQPKMTVQQVRDALKDFYIEPTENRYVETDLISIDNQGRIYIHGRLSTRTTVPKVERMPLQLESVSALYIVGLETLEGLPRQILHYLELQNFMGSDLTTANSVTMIRHGQIYLRFCENLTTLKGIENFKLDQEGKMRIFIKKCEKLEFDPYAYVHTNNYIFQFQDTIPSQMPLVKAVALTNSDQIYFGHLKDRKLAAIIDKYRSKGEVVMRELRNALRANEKYMGHARIT